jgi:cell division transport system permease protein
VKPINALIYVMARGLRGMGQSPLVQLVAIGTMAVCMLMLGTATLIFQNAQDVAEDWGVDVPMTVYMVEGTDPELTEALAGRLATLPEVDHAQRIPPQEALDRLTHGLGGQSSMLEGIDPDALPDSVEVYLRPETDPEFSAALATRIDGYEGVEEVAVLGPWVQQAQDLLRTLRDLAIGVGLLVSLACMAIVWSTIRLGVFARRAEIHILRLVGGTPSFVRGPFLVQGMLQGLLGTALALVGLWLAFDFVSPYLEEGLSLVFAAGSIHFFSVPQVVIALAFGGCLGVLGSRGAVARYVEV